MQKCSAVIIGVGPEQGLGATLARCFSGNGLHVFIAGRSEDKLCTVAETIWQAGGSASTVVTDATVELDVAQLFSQVRLEGYSVDIAAYNVDSNIPAPLLETDTETFTKLWQQNCLGAFFFGKEAINAMKDRRQGTLFFTGATASLRAKPPFTAFASAKAVKGTGARYGEGVFATRHPCRTHDYRRSHRWRTGKSSIPRLCESEGQRWLIAARCHC